jgi:outer membrane protein assembly factor BamE
MALSLLAACARPTVPDLPEMPKMPSLPSLPSVPIGFRIDVQQGNVITQEMVAQLRPGMDKKKVNFIMGSPAIMDTFHGDRWDYVYTFQSGRGRPEKRRVTLYFENNLLARVDGDVKTAEGPIDVDLRQDQQVEVPGVKPGMMSRIADKLPFVGPEGTADAEEKEKEEKTPEVVVPDDAPLPEKKGFWARIFSRDNEDEE